MDFELAQLEHFPLKVFRAVAAHLNFRKAAEHLFLSQPAVSLQIEALENDLGVASSTAPLAGSPWPGRGRSCSVARTRLQR